MGLRQSGLRIAQSGLRIAISCVAAAGLGLSGGPGCVAAAQAATTGVQVSAWSGGDTCAVLSSGRLDCWGDDQDGQLGNGTVSTTVSETPVEVSGIADAIQAAAGFTHSCALLATGHILCWGEAGLLGNGTDTAASTPVEVTGIADATQLTSGYGHSCAVLSSGHLDCWGSDHFGQLGDGSSGEAEAQAPVEVKEITDAAQVAAGLAFTCALLSTGHVECWGANSNGELGDGNGKSSDTPVEVTGIADATQITAGWYHACAVLLTGQVDCWGYNAFGELGTAAPGSISKTPVQVQEVSTATQAAAGGLHSCALLLGGHIDCWGQDTEGQLGNGGFSETPVYSPVEVSGIADAAQLAAGYQDTCAVLASGPVDCWGGGPLGDGSPDGSDLPVEADLLSEPPSEETQPGETGSTGENEGTGETGKGAGGGSGGTGAGSGSGTGSNQGTGSATGTNGGGSGAGDRRPAPAASASATPQLAATGDLAPISGTVRLRLAGTRKLVPLSAARLIPFGALVDATHGRVRVTAAGPHGASETGEFGEGQFVLRQGRSGLVTAELAGGDFSVCPYSGSHRRLARQASAGHDAGSHGSGKHAVRKLWANTKENFSTKGNYVTTTVEDPEWVTDDLCDGTLVHVIRGKLSLTNLVTHRRATVSAGHSYLARAG